MPPPTKLLIMCWGYSIHAERRAKIFIEDPSFQVTVVSNYDYGFSGAQNVRLLAARIALPPDQPAKSRWENLSRLIRRICRRPELTLLPDLLILLGTVKKFQPDIILLQTLLYPNFLAYVLPKNIPQVITFWNGDITWWAKWNGIERLLKKQIVTYGVRRATAITVNSQTAFAAALTYGILLDKIYLIGYPGIDLNVFHAQDKLTARQKLGLPSSSPIIFWPRGLGGYLNSELFLQALAQMATNFPDFRVVIFSKVGGPTELDRHRQIAQDLGIEDKIIWIKEASFVEMPLYYASADVMVSLSSNDSRPNVMLEAMACGTPVIMGDIPATREWVTTGVNGYLVPLQDSPQLAQTLLQTLNPTNISVNQALAAHSQQLIKERADNQTVTAQIKQLLHQVAHPSTGPTQPKNKLGAIPD